MKAALIFYTNADGGHGRLYVGPFVAGTDPLTLPQVTPFVRSRVFNVQIIDPLP